MIQFAVRTSLSILLLFSCLTAHANNDNVSIAAQIPTGGATAYILNPTKVPSAALQRHRDDYHSVLQSLQKKPRRNYQRLMRKLQNYPLAPYLNYIELTTRLRNLPHKEVDTYLSKYHDTPYANRLKAKWLIELKRRHKGEMFIAYYDAKVANTALNCYYQYARYRTGDKASALKGGLALWNVGKSQPKDCDPLFEILVDNHQITEELAWQRYMKSLLNHQYTLARYLQRFMISNHYQQRAALFSAVHKDPTKLSNFSDFTGQDDDTKAIIADALKHLATRDARQALNYWNRYHQSHQFNKKTTTSINEKLVKTLYEQNHIAAADIYLQDSLTHVPSSLIEWRIREALRDANWPDIKKWITLLPADYQSTARWQYWRARAEQVIDHTSPTKIYQRLAKKRTFYGFLASDLLHIPYQMQDTPIKSDQQEILALAATPAVQRAIELFHVGDTLSANREWYYATRNLSKTQMQAAAELANRHSWDNQSIMSMIKASYWDDLQLRFPLTYQEPIQHYGNTLNVESNLLMAIARQESALSPTAVSPAGAKGLMQMMPATATATAKRFKIKYRNSQDLLDVDKNIELCSNYYKKLLGQFNNNRILASAGYNAGPNRAKQWLKKSQSRLGFDMWIETIPYKETRGYVQNVLAFSAIYQYRMGQTPRMLTEPEKQQML